MQSVQFCGGWTVCGQAGGKSFKGCVTVEHSHTKICGGKWKVQLENVLVINHAMNIF